MLAISPDGREGYTANVAPGTVSVLDLAGQKNFTVIPVAGTRAARFGLIRRPLGVHLRQREASALGN
jgi:hypothetical protein